MATPRVSTVRKTFDLLRLMHANGGAMHLGELSRAAAMPESSVHRLVNTLEDMGVLLRTVGGYRPGMAVLSLCGGESAQGLLHDLSTPILRDVARSVGGAVHIATLEGQMVSYVVKVGSHGAGAVPTRPGTQLEAYCTALGKVLLAGLSAAEFEAYLASGGFVRLTERTLVEPALLAQEVSRVRQRGYAVDDREMYPEIRCVAVPVHDATGRVAAAMSVARLWREMDEPRQQACRRALTDASTRLRRRLFGVGPDQ